MISTCKISSYRNLFPHLTGLPNVSANLRPRSFAQAAVSAGVFRMPNKGWRGNETFRFWSRVKITESGCWEWTGGKDQDGYCIFDSDFGSKFKSVRGHRWVYEKFVAKIPKEKQIDHLCRNRCCVNPLHMEPVTSKVNTHRGFGLCGINNRKTHCVHGHELAGSNLYIAPKTGWRQCKTCLARRDKEQKSKNHAKKNHN